MVSNEIQILSKLHEQFYRYIEEDRSNPSLRLIREALQLVTTSLGDFLRYKEVEIDKLNESSNLDLSGPKSCYSFGRQIAPWNGTAHKAESIVANMKSDIFSVIYFLSRSICTENPYDAHETLLMIFDRERYASEALRCVILLRIYLTYVLLARRV